MGSVLPLTFSLAVEANFSSPEDREIVRRKRHLILAQEYLLQAEQKMRARDYESAYKTYLETLSQIISGGPVAAKFRQTTMVKFSSAAIHYARWLIQNKRYGDAKKVAETVLLPQNNPAYRPALRLLAQLERSDFRNKTITPDFTEHQNEIARLWMEAEGFCSAARFDLAQRRYEQILSIDPYNTAARQGEERLHRSKDKYYQQAAQEGRSRLLWQVTKGWERPVSQFQNDRSGVCSNVDGIEEIRAKLNKILLPKVEFHDVTVREAIDFLKQRSRELDPTPIDSGGRRGINIVLKWENEKMRTFPAISTDPGPTQENNPRINLNLTNIPLYEAIRYVSELAGLKVKVEPYAVSIVPLSESTDQLITKEYRVLPSFLPARPADLKSAGGIPGLNSISEKSKPWVRIGAQEYLQSQGVPFPKGSFANYMPAGSRLIVRNTPDALNLIDSLVTAANGAAPLQVQIESKFVNISQDNLKQLGFDWLLGPVSLPGGFALSGGDGSATDPSHDAITNPDTGFPLGGNPITSNLRTGTSLNTAVSFNSINALLAQGFNKSLASSLFRISGIFTRPQFQVVMRALSQTKGVDLVSAPKVTARSGQKATIKMIHAFPYPTEFHPPQIPQKGIVASKDVLPNNAFISQTVTPTTPTRFEVRNTGITMEVEPVVGPDGLTIDLNLSPEVVDFDGFVNYGVPILGIVNQAVTGIPSSTVLTQNTIHQPIFSTRKVTTSVSIWDGQTVALGGLMREDTQKVEDKIPLLGDIPLVGQLFRSNLDQKIKENLIIFVTARLIDTQGRPIRPEEEEGGTINPRGY